MLVIICIVLLGLLSGAHSCSIHSFSAALAAKPFLNKSHTAYTTEEVLEALEGLDSSSSYYVNPNKTTFACVDARGRGYVNEPSALSPSAALESPGGDFAELQALIIAYHRVKGTAPSAKSVTKIFNSFVQNVASKTRPFYLHTAEDKLLHAFEKFYNLTGEEVIVIPKVQPEDKNISDAWYESLSAPEAQGCGHIRYMMQKPHRYNLTTPAEAAVPAQLVKAFFRYWWPTQEGSKQRRRVVYPILQGALGGRAVAIVNNVGPACPDKEPDLAPFHGGSSMFVLQANAAAAMRSSVLMPFIKFYDPKINTTAVLEALTALQAKQLTATLQLLAPLNALPIYAVNVTTSP